MVNEPGGAGLQSDPRLVELIDAGLVRQDDRYELTELGHSLGVGD